MIVSRGLGRGSAGALVAAGLGLSAVATPPIDEIIGGGAGVRYEARHPRFLDVDGRDILELLPIIVGVINANN